MHVGQLLPEKSMNTGLPSVFTAPAATGADAVAWPPWTSPFHPTMPAVRSYTCLKP